MDIEKLDSYCPANKKEWRAWLKKNHIQKDSIWLIIYKKNSATPTISWSEAVDEALCFGWIDSVKKTVDEERYIQYFGKRKSNSTWSKINKDKVEQLIANGLMTEAGYKCIEIAKSNGSWTILDTVEALIIPEDLAQEFKKNPGSQDFFLSLSKSGKKILLTWIVQAKRPEARKKRIVEIAQNAAQKLKPKPFR